MLYRFLEKKLDNRFIRPQIPQGLRDMNFYKLGNEGYVPANVSNVFTDTLHKKFQFRTDMQIIPTKKMKKICNLTKKGKTLLTFSFTTVKDEMTL
jgi:hypothetical protein